MRWIWNTQKNKYYFVDYLADMPIYRMTKEEVQKRKLLVKNESELLKKYKLVNKKIQKVKIIGPCTIKEKKSIKGMICTKSVMEHIGK